MRERLLATFSLVLGAACGPVPAPPRPIVSNVDASLDAEGAMRPTPSQSYHVWPRVQTLRTNGRIVVQVFHSTGGNEMQRLTLAFPDRDAPRWVDASVVWYEGGGLWDFTGTATEIRGVLTTSPGSVTTSEGSWILAYDLRAIRDDRPVELRGKIALLRSDLEQ